MKHWSPHKTKVSYANHSFIPQTTVPYIYYNTQASMSPESRIRSLNNKIEALESKLGRYIDRLDMLEDTLLMGTEGAWPHEIVPGMDREKKQRDIATLKVKIARVESDIEKLEGEVDAIRQGASGSSGTTGRFRRWCMENGKSEERDGITNYHSREESFQRGWLILTGSRERCSRELRLKKLVIGHVQVRIKWPKMKRKKIPCNASSHHLQHPNAQIEFKSSSQPSAL